MRHQLFPSLKQQQLITPHSPLFCTFGKRSEHVAQFSKPRVNQQDYINIDEDLETPAVLPDASKITYSQHLHSGDDMAPDSITFSMDNSDSDLHLLGQTEVRRALNTDSR